MRFVVGLAAAAMSGSARSCANYGTARGTKSGRRIGGARDSDADDRHTIDPNRPCVCPAQISTCVPSSISRLPGIWKNAVAGIALRAMNANSLSRHSAMPGDARRDDAFRG